MDIPWGDEHTNAITENVSLITSDGPVGPNIMTAVWVHQISYKPGLIAIHLGPTKATTKNITHTKKFGVNVASEHQNVLVSLAGGSSGKIIDKIALLKELGIKFYTGKNGLLMVKDASINMECKLVQEITLGDHIMFVGEVTDIKSSGKTPLVYHEGKFWKLSEIQKPSEAEKQNYKEMVLRFRKK